MAALGDPQYTVPNVLLLEESPIRISFLILFHPCQPVLLLLDTFTRGRWRTDSSGLVLPQAWQVSQPYLTGPHRDHESHCEYEEIWGQGRSVLLMSTHVVSPRFTRSHLFISKLSGSGTATSTPPWPAGLPSSFPVATLKRSTFL